MGLRLLWIVLIVQAIVMTAILLVLPRIMRRGLLFGVYVGEDRWDGDEVRAISRGWYLGTVGALGASLLVGLALGLASPATPAGPVAAVLALVLLSPLVYLRAYFRARALGVPVPAAPAEATLAPDHATDVAWPIFAISLGIVAGTLAIGHAALHYGDMPARVPTHFGPAGRPDAWAPRTVGSVMALPFGTLVMGVVLGVTALLTARAKRTPRAGDQGVSIAAQLRFRNAMTRFLSGIAILTTVMMMLLSIGAVRVMIGQASALPTLVVWPMTAALAIYAVGGSLYLMFRYGQGGARLERGAGDAPLTDGLADNSRWVLGAFYVNRDDPSFFVEKRFGFGYTINFGNPKAVLLLVLFLAAIGALVAMGLASGS